MRSGLFVLGELNAFSTLTYSESMSLCMRIILS